MSPRLPTLSNPSKPEDPTVVFIGNAVAGPETAQLGLVCRFYGFRLVVASALETDERAPLEPLPDAPQPVLVIVHASELSGSSASRWHALQASSDRHRIPTAVVGITSDCDQENLALFTDAGAIGATAAGPACGLWVTAADPASTGFELRGLQFALGPGPAYQLECPGQIPVRVMATVGPDEPASRPAMLRVDRNGVGCYLLTRTAVADPCAPWQFRRSCFGEIASLFLLLSDAGENRGWHAPSAFANLTIDDPWLTEPYGCMSFPGLLAEMRRERFHATIGFVPWNYDHNAADMVALFHANPDFFSIAVHGNNHDRYEFYHYEARPGDQQRAKPLAEQIINIRQASARMEEFRRRTGLDFDRVMVFPHGVCPAATFSVLKAYGFWATSNYSNVPLGEIPPVDATAALRSVNTEWSGFPALRRNYPQNYSKEAVAIDLFLGNPVLFMGHQDMFFDGIDTFNAHARMVNECQPAVRWTSLGEISRHLFLIRWLNNNHCEIRLMSRHAKIINTQPFPVEFQFTKHEPDLSLARVTIDGVDVSWGMSADWVHFATTIPPGATSLIELYYHPLAEHVPVDVRRRGVRNHILRAIAEFRDLTLARSRIGRFLTRRYYRPGQRRPTLSGLLSRLTTFK